MNKARTLVAATALLSIALAGCADDPPTSVEARAVVSDSLLVLSIQHVDGELAYSDLLIIVNDAPWRMGAVADHEQKRYSVDGKSGPQDKVARGDVIRVPSAGDTIVELRNKLDGSTFQVMELSVPDSTPPPQSTPTAPSAGATAVSRQAVFQWTAVDDLSGVTYQLRYWVHTPVASLAEERVFDITGTSHAVSSSNPLLPQTTYQWQVRAMDGAGNAGEWSNIQEFQTAA